MSSTDGNPRARLGELVTQELESGETVVYDRTKDRIHCLNRAAAVVWQHCDGSRSVADLARVLHDEAGVPEDRAIVDMALAELRKAKLLESLPSAAGLGEQMTRRQAVERLGYGAVIGALLPFVASIVAPKPAAAASCLPNGARCGGGQGVCCSGNCVGGICVP